MGPKWERLNETYHRLLHIYFLPPRKAKVCDLGGQVLSNQHISGSQVPVDELQAMSEVREERDGAQEHGAGWSSCVFLPTYPLADQLTRDQRKVSTGSHASLPNLGHSQVQLVSLFLVRGD